MRYLLATAIMLVLLYLTFWLIAALQSGWAVLLPFSFMFGVLVTPQVDKLLARFEK